MKSIRLIASPVLVYVLMELYILVLAAATFVENSYGSAIAREHFYHASWLMPLQLLQVANLSAMSLQGSYLRRISEGSLIFHGTFLSVWSGVTVAHYVGVTGIIRIRERETANNMMKDEGIGMEKTSLLFSVTLDDLRLERYPGPHNPMSYESDLVIERESESPLQTTARTNEVIDVGGYRLFQSSFGPDKRGIVLSVSYDRPGIRLTYTGHFLSLVGFVFALLSRESHFRRLRKELGEIRNNAPFYLLFFLVLSGISSIQILSVQQKSVSL